MGAVELRDKIKQLINTDNVSYLKAIFDYAEQKKNDEQLGIIAYTVQGKPLTKKDYINKIKTTEASVNAGNFTTVEDLENEIETW